MKPILFYLIQVIASSGILYGYYHFFLRNNKFHQYNRYYLLSATVISIIVPFLNIPVYLGSADQQPMFIKTLTVFHSGDIEPEIIAGSISGDGTWLTWQNALSALYVLMAGLLFTRFCMALIRIARLVRIYPGDKVDNIRFYSTNEPATPFSFFRWLFWNNKIEINSDHGQQIFRHELYHIRQRHSWDIIFLEILSIFFWVNPFFHLIKKEITAIHEFLADKFAVEENKEWDYAELLLMQVLGAPNTRLSNPFFHNQIKRRIAMLTTSKQPGYQYLRKIMVLPFAIVTIALFAFTYKNKQTDSVISPDNGIMTANDGTHGGIDLFDDTIPPKISNKFVYQDKSSPITLRADSIIWKSEPGKSQFNSGKALFVINGKKTRANVLKDKSVIASLITIYDKNDPRAIDIYGEEAREGVIIFENAHLVDTKAKDDHVTDQVGVKTGSDNKTIQKLDIEPAFPGGVTAWKKHLDRNLDASVPLRKGAPAGRYTVFVQFLVGDDGRIIDVQALTNHGFGMEEQAVNIIQKGPSWLPGLLNGKTITAYKKQPIHFTIPVNDKTTAGDPEKNTRADEVVVVGYGKNKQDNPSLAEVEVVGYSRQKASSEKEVEVVGYPSKNNSDMKEIVVVGYPTRRENGEKEVTMENNAKKKSSNGNGSGKEVYPKGNDEELKEVVVTGYPSKKNVEKSPSLEEVTVVGYGTKRKEPNLDENAAGEPQFPGGKTAWRKYLEKNTDGSIPVDNGAPEGTYKVEVLFIVNADGSLRDIKALTNHGYGMEEEAVRLLNNSPEWIPALQNGKKVTAYKLQPIIFQIEEEKEKITPAKKIPVTKPD